MYGNTRAAYRGVCALEVIKFLSKTAKIAATIFSLCNTIDEQRCDLPGCDRCHGRRAPAGPPPAPQHNNAFWSLSSTAYPCLMLPPCRPQGMCAFCSNSWPPTSVLRAANMNDQAKGLRRGSGHNFPANVPRYFLCIARNFPDLARG